MPSSPQPRPPKVNCPRPHRHQRQAKGPAASVLQEQEVRPPGPPPQADARHPPQIITRGQGPRPAEGQEAQHSLPSAQVRCQGTAFPLLSWRSDESSDMFCLGCLNIIRSAWSRIWVEGESGFGGVACFFSEQQKKERLRNLHRMAHGNLGLTCTYFPFRASLGDGLV